MGRWGVGVKQLSGPRGCATHHQRTLVPNQIMRDVDQKQGPR
jgi:hypothetical protein